MTKEQEEAIEMLEDIKNNTWTTKYIMSSDSVKAETVLSMLKEKDKEIENKDKIIDLMAEYMEENMDEYQLDKIYAKQYNCNGMERNWTRGKEKEVKDIKQYFERKVKKCTEDG